MRKFFMSKTISIYTTFAANIMFFGRNILTGGLLLSGVIGFAAAADTPPSSAHGQTEKRLRHPSPQAFPVDTEASPQLQEDVHRGKTSSASSPTSTHQRTPRMRIAQAQTDDNDLSQETNTEDTELHLSDDPGWTKTSRWWGKAVNPIAKAKRKERQGKYKSAANIYGRLANDAEHSENTSLCLIRKGDLLFQHEEYKKAFQAYRKASRYEPRIRTSHVLERIRRIGRRLSSGDGQHFSGKRNRETAIEALSYVSETAPTRSQVRADMLRLGRLYEKTGQYKKAKNTYRELIRSGSSTEANVAHLRMARLLYRESKEKNGTGDLLVRAEAHIDDYLRAQEPDAKGRKHGQALIDKIKRLRAQRLLDLGRFYTREAHQRNQAAKEYLTRVSENFENTPEAERARRILNQTVRTQSTESDQAQAPGKDADKASETGNETASADKPETAQMQKWLRPVEDLNLDEKGADKK